MKISVLEKGAMIFKGSKVLKAIMDNYTPPIDLFVREVIQNSADAILDNKDYGIIKFSIGEFHNNSLSLNLEKVGEKLDALFGGKKCKFIAISDSNTTGLLGEAYEKEDGSPNNLYNLVYDFMNDKEGDTNSLGGSRGIGKSVYYRYGIGLCFYYSRTFENNKYISKLAGALIQNEKEPGCFLGKNSSGIAYFGDIVDEKRCPIYDETEIEKFLNIFGLKKYDDDKTGTTVIIPYIDEQNLLETFNNCDEQEKGYWLSNLEDCIKMSIQRWYFPRINNEAFLKKGKYLKIAVNNVKLELCDFFSKLQMLYNGTLDGMSSISISSSNIPDGTLGNFNYKIFTAEELGVYLPPLNNPSPKHFVDSSSNVDKQGVLFYTRKSGMILNYDNSEFGTYEIEDGKFLIGIFVLNDDLDVHGEKLGDYLRKTEAGNHIEWTNDNFPKFPVLSKRKPFKKISASIRTYLNNVFKKSKAVTVEGSATIYQKKFGELLMPPQDFGDKPSIPTKPHKGGKGGGGGGSGEPPMPKLKKTLIVFNGINSNGLLDYSVEFILNKNEFFNFKIDIKAGSNTFSFEQWEQLEFEFPAKVERIDIADFSVAKIKTPYTQPILDDNFSKKKTIKLAGESIFKVQGFSTVNGRPFAFKAFNLIDKQIRILMNVQIKAIDFKYSIGFTYDVGKEETTNE